MMCVLLSHHVCLYCRSAYIFEHYIQERVVSTQGQCMMHIYTKREKKHMRDTTSGTRV